MYLSTKNNMSEHSIPTPKSQLNLQEWWITATLIAVNVGLFIWQVLQGMNITEPTTMDAIKWGADYAPLSFLAEPIRLFTSMFFHFGLIHLMLNMWALYIFGNVSEQLFGRLYFIGLYVLAGLGGSLLSGYISIQDSYELIRLGQPEPSLYPSVGAGASGAVMGLGAALTLLSLLPRLPQQRFILDRKTLLIVMGLNLVMGFSISGINNAAHIGGMMMGAVMAAAWYLAQKTTWTVLAQSIALLLGMLLCYAAYQYCLYLIVDIAPFWKELAQWILDKQNA